LLRVRDPGGRLTYRGRGPADGLRAVQ